MYITFLIPSSSDFQYIKVSGKIPFSNTFFQMNMHLSDICLTQNQALFLKGLITVDLVYKHKNSIEVLEI